MGKGTMTEETCIPEIPGQIREEIGRRNPHPAKLEDWRLEELESKPLDSFWRIRNRMSVFEYLG